MAESVFRRSEQIIKANTKRRKNMKILVLMISLVIAILGVGAYSMLSDNNPDLPPIISDTSDVSVGDTSKPDTDNSDQIATSEPDNSTDVSTPPIEVLTIYTTAGGAGEFAADMYRPEGYHDNIGSVLALMMHYTPEDDAAFNVLIYPFKDMKIEDVISKVNETISEEIPLDQLKQVEVENDITESIKKYHLILNKEQINALAENKVNCMYIGSGIGDYKDMNWDTVEGIKTYCEIRGDMYTFNGRGVDSDSDIYPED